MHAEFRSDECDPDEPLTFEDPESSTKLCHGDMIGLRGECSVSFVTLEVEKCECLVDTASGPCQRVAWRHLKCVSSTMTRALMKDLPEGAHGMVHCTSLGMCIVEAMHGTG